MPMKIAAAIILVSCCAFGQDKAAISLAEAACGPRDAKFYVKTESQHPAPEPENGKATMYVVGGQGGVISFGMDGKWAGATEGRTYFFVSVDPGEHHLCAMTHTGKIGSPWVSLHSLKVEAGITYYFFPHFTAAPLSFGEFVLEQVDPDQGKYNVANAKFSSSHQTK
jgi:hypothetical protein